jgi:hypothetical protein
MDSIGNNLGPHRSSWILRKRYFNKIKLVTINQSFSKIKAFFIVVLRKATVHSMAK